MAIPCGKQDCPESGTHAVKLVVPCVGEALAQHRPLELIVGVILCEPHIRNANVQDFFVDRPRLLGTANPPPAESPFKPLFRRAAGADGKEPDFDRAFIAPIPLASPEWQEFEARTKLSEPQGHA